MDEKKFLLISMDDERAKKLSEVLGNKTCKKIIDFLAEIKEASEKDIADSLKLPLNTTEYNLKKLVHAELVEKTKNFFWSQKGKRIPMYKLSNKSIIISPKSKISSKIKSVLPVAILSGLAAVGIKFILGTKTLVENTARDETMVFAAEKVSGASQAASQLGEGFLFTTPPTVWLWFLSGAILAILIFAILNWRKL